MTIEAGALALRITETGAEEVEKKLDRIDQKGKALGKAPVRVPIAPPTSTDLTLIDRQLEQMGKQIPLYKQGAQFASTKAGALRELGSVEHQLRQIVAGSNTTLEQRIGAERQLAQLMGGAPTRVGAVSSAWKSFGTTLGALGIAVSIEKIIGSMLSLVRTAIATGDELHDLAMRTGVSVETLSVLAPVAEKSGASMEALTIGFRGLSKSVENLKAGNKEAVATFAALGITAKDLEGLSLDQIFIKIANAQEQFADGSGKSAEMVRIFGRSGELLIPMLHELADGGFDRAREKAERLGGVVSKEFSDQADQFNDNLKDMHTALGGLARAIIEDSLPGMIRFTDWMATVISKGRPFISTLIEAAEKAAALMFLGPGGPSLFNKGKPLPGLTLTPVLTPEELRAQLPPRPELFRKPPPTAEATRAAKEEAAIIAKALAVDLGNIPLRDLISRTPPKIAGEPTVGVDSKGKMKGVGKAAPVVDAEFDALAAKIAERQRQLGELIQGVGSVLGNALASGITAAFKGGNFFAEMGKALLAGIGSMLVQLGSAMLTYGLLMAVGLPLLIASPFAAQALSAPAAIAAGTGLIALGAGMGALAGGGGKGGAGGGGKGGAARAPGPEERNEWEVAFDPDRKLRKKGPAVVPSARSLGSGAMPEARPVVNIGVINTLHPDNAEWQRKVAETYNNARGRGLIRHG